MSANHPAVTKLLKRLKTDPSREAWIARQHLLWMIELEKLSGPQPLGVPLHEAMRDPAVRESLLNSGEPMLVDMASSYQEVESPELKKHLRAAEIQQRRASMRIVQKKKAPLAN